MDIHAYIESGQLEAYVQGLLSEQEMQEVDTLATTHPEVRKELEEIRAAVQLYAPAAVGPTPPSLETVIGRLQEAQTIPSSPTLSSASIPTQKPSKLLPLILAASLVLFLSSMGINYYLFQENNRLQNRVTLLENNDSYLAQQYQVSKTNPVVIPDPQAFLASSDHIRIPLAGLETAPDFSAVVFMNPQSREVFIHIENLPQPPEGHQYQLWAIKDGVSLDAGIFDFHSDIQRLRPMEVEIQAFAVTLEESGGSPLPNLSRMFVKGEVPVG